MLNKLKKIKLKMKIPLIFLGTGQAIPTARRNHTAILLKYKQENILLDCGEGTQRQFRKAKLNPCKITRILITHWHGDHVLGLPGLFQTLALNNYNKTLHIYGPRGTKKFISLLYKLFVFKEKIKIQVREIKKGKVFETSDFHIESLPMTHNTPCLAYSFIEKDKIRINKKKLNKLNLKGKVIAEIVKGKDISFQGKKIKASDLIYIEKGKKIAIIFDTSLNNNCYKIAKNSDLLICESTFLESSESGKNLAREYKHLTASQAAQIAKKARVKKLILTHLSQRYGGKEKIILQEAKKVFKNTTVAEDLNRIEI